MYHDVWIWFVLIMTSLQIKKNLKTYIEKTPAWNSWYACQNYNLQIWVYITQSIKLSSLYNISLMPMLCQWSTEWRGVKRVPSFSWWYVTTPTQSQWFLYHHCLSVEEKLLHWRVVTASSSCPLLTKQDFHSVLIETLCKDILHSLWQEKLDNSNHWVS